MSDPVQIRFGRWTVAVSPDETRQAFLKLPVGNPGGCRCLDCANFAAQRERIYPQEFRELLEQLGVDWRKESEVNSFGVSGGKLTCEGCFHFVGSIVDGPQDWSELLRAEDNFRVSFVAAYRASPFQELEKNGVPLATVEFWVQDVPSVVGDAKDRSSS